jgi:CheY-like chemotaxis protein
MVLLIDDNSDDLEIIGRAFADVEGVEVKAMQSAAEALAWFRLEGEPDTLVMTDLNMPGVDGIDVIVRLRELFAVPPVVLVLSTSARAVDVDRAYEAGANGYHIKPMGFHETTELCASISKYWLGAAARPRLAVAPMSGSG